LAKLRKASFLRLSRFPKEYVPLEKLQKLGFRQSGLKYSEATVCWVLDISKPEEELLKNMRKSHRYLIKKSQTTGLTITQSTSVNNLEKFLPLYKSLSQTKHFVAHSGVTEEFEGFAKDNQEVLFLAYFEGKVIAGAIIAFVGDMAIYRHAMSDKQYNNIPASYALQWEAIKEAKKRGIRFYNFWGIAPPESDKKHPWQGFTLFKTGFGGEYEFFLPTLDFPLALSYWKTHAIDIVSTKRKELGI
jgi:lipid II:glycine glycyltransferase (peptidoglycan interpeptide bridge formation enzyme)